MDKYGIVRHAIDDNTVLRRKGAIFLPDNSGKNTDIIIIIIGTTAPFEPRPSSEASASCPYSL